MADNNIIPLPSVLKQPVDLVEMSPNEGLALPLPCDFVEVGRILVADLILDTCTDLVIARSDFEEKRRLFRVGDYALERRQMLELICLLSETLLEDAEVRNDD